MSERKQWDKDKYLVRINPGKVEEFAYASAFLEFLFLKNPETSNHKQVLIQAFEDPKGEFEVETRENVDLRNKTVAEIVREFWLLGLDEESLSEFIQRAESMLD